MRNKGKTRVVKNEGRRDGKKPPRGNVSYVDIEQVKQRYGGRPAKEARKNRKKAEGKGAGVCICCCLASYWQA